MDLTRLFCRVMNLVRLQLGLLRDVRRECDERCLRDCSVHKIGQCTRDRCFVYRVRAIVGDVEEAELDAGVDGDGARVE